MDLLTTKAYAQSCSDVLLTLGSDASRGLDEPEAQRRLLRDGPNQLKEKGGTPQLLRLLGQFNNPLLITLLVVGGVKVGFGHPRDALVIISVTVINAVIGFVQESKAEGAIAALAKAVRTEVDVVRSGVPMRVPSEELVIGDLVRLEAGVKVPADLRLITARQLQTDESALTGESLPVAKGTLAVAADAPLAERVGMAYAGTYVTGGQADAVVVATADATEVGSISRSLQEQISLSTPLTRQFARFSRTLLKVIVVMAALTFAVGLMPDVQRTHVGFMGCHGALNGLRVARAFAESDASAVVLLCCVELCSLHLQYGADREQVVANALFADGAAAVVASVQPPGCNAALRLEASGSTVIPGSADLMHWQIADHGFSMGLSPRVPQTVAHVLRPWLNDWLSPWGLDPASITSWAMHPGGPRILSACGEALGLKPYQLDCSQAVLHDHGNMSSATILFILERLRQSSSPGPCLALAFGPGLCAEVALFHLTAGRDETTQPLEQRRAP